MDLVAQIVDIAERAGRLQLLRRPSLVVRGTKAHVNDLVSDVDVASEQLITDAIAAAWPADGILGEEGHDIAGTSGRRWIVDPLDGTRNYVTASGPWSVSIALYDGGRPLAAVVHDPALGETFTAATDNRADPAAETSAAAADNGAHGAGATFAAGQGARLTARRSPWRNPARWTRRSSG